MNFQGNRAAVGPIFAKSRPCGRFFVFAAMALIVLAAPACRRKAPPYSPAVPPADMAEEEYRREIHRRSRPAAPETYTVPPRPPRDNSFGEFDEGMGRGLDPQPVLPPLPADDLPAPRALPPAYDGRVGAAMAPPGGYVGRVPPASTPRYAPSGIPSGGETSFPLPRYVPVEQLIYGGGHGESDHPDEYRFMPRDVVTFTVRDHPEFSGTAEIQPDGTIRIPNSPDLTRIRGLTADMAAEEIRKTLQPYILGECAVRVQANRARGGYYHVLGDVLQPGRFPMGMEPVRLSEAILAANWEANPSRLDMDGDELSPSFPAAAPRGRSVSPRSADLANVMLVTPHRSRPSRTIHDVRGSFLGRTADDPVVRPGQIVIVPSLLPEKNAMLGLDLPPAREIPPKTFSGPGTPARLPDMPPPLPPPPPAPTGPAMSPVEENMAVAFDETKHDPETMTDGRETGDEYLPYGARVVKGKGGGGTARRNRLSGW